MKSVIRILGQLLALGIIFGVIAGFAGSVHPAFDTIAHFRLHFSVLLLIGVPFLLLVSARKFAILAALVGSTGFYTASSGTVLTAVQKEPDIASPIYSLYHLNLLWINSEKLQVIEQLRDLDPDFLSITEQGRAWRETFVALHDVWPYQYQCRQGGQRNATSIYSKWKIIEGSQFCGPYAALARVDVETPEDGTMTLVSTHFRWPWPASGPEQLEEVLPHLETFKADALVAGDFNATTWSWAMEKFATAAGLEIVPGIGSTWMAGNNFLETQFWLGLPIDNVLSKGGVDILSAKTLDEMGSDHLPIWVEFQLR